MTYRAAPVTQRDGSALANSNCRMAAIATGLDYETLGGETSTGAKMRSYQDDQSGGTGSDDASVAWHRGYGKDLRIRDGNPWGDVLDDLRAGRLVHLDVWHAAVGGPCLSGSGAYGHTIAVAPESRDKDGDTEWLVADPWCKPPTWAWVRQGRLRDGAEEWGRRVTREAETNGPLPPAGVDRQRRLSAAARRLMKRHYPGAEAPGMPWTNDDEYDTGGADGAPRAVSVLFTTTKAQTGVTAVGIYWNPSRWTATKDIPVYLDHDGSR